MSKTVSTPVPPKSRSSEAGSITSRFCASVTMEKVFRETMTEYRIGDITLDPEVYLTVKDSGVLLTGRFLAEATRLRAVEQTVWKFLLTEFHAHGGIDLAYPTERRV